MESTLKENKMFSRNEKDDIDKREKEREKIDSSI